MEVLGFLPYSSNHTFLARCRTATSEALAVYKPARGERPLWDFGQGSLYRRELAAYLVSEALGWGFVPPTVIRDDAPLGRGSVQLYIEHDPEQHYLTLLPGREPLFRALALFDIVCNNADRKSGHCLLDASGRVWAVDHGLTFHCDDKLRTVIWDFAGKPVGPSECEAMTRLGRALQEGQPLGKRLGELLTQEELSTLLIRVAERLGPSTYPHPASSWSFPWPLI
jgi:hypothetical protein